MQRVNLIKASTILASAVFAASPALAQSADWNGGYIGAEIGGANMEMSFRGLSRKYDRVMGGIVVGYDVDFGKWVVGGGVDYEITNIGSGRKYIDSFWRVKLRAGYKIGKGLIYATGGYANMNMPGISGDGGYVIGGGYDVMISQSLSVGVEVLYHNFDNFAGSPVDFDLTTTQVRAVYRF